MQTPIVKTLTDPELIKHYKEYVGRVGGVHSFDQIRCTPDRVDRSLELELCKAFASNPDSIITSPPQEEDFKGIDVIANGWKIQVKCLTTDYLVLEDCKYRNGVRIPGRVDNCQADYWLKCKLNDTGIRAELYIVKDLKELLNQIRKAGISKGMMGQYYISKGSQGDHYEGAEFYRVSF